MRSTLLEGSFETPSADVIEGDLPDIDELVYNYLKAEDTHVPTSRLFLSNMGMCPRKLILKESGVEVSLTQRALWKRQSMFDQANHVADTIAEALHHAGRLCAFEESISDLLPTPWGGRFDILALYPGRRFWEVKSAHPNQIRYSQSLPKKEQVWQALAYEAWGGYVYDTKAAPLIHNTDRGGENPSILSEVVLPKAWWEIRATLPECLPVKHLLDVLLAAAKGSSAEADFLPLITMCEAMLALEDALEDYDKKKIVPAPLARACGHRTSRHGDLYIPVEIYLDRDWRCNRCDYVDSPACKPPKGHTGVLEFDREEHTWRVMKNGHSHVGEAVAYIENELHIPQPQLEGGEQGQLVE